MKTKYLSFLRYNKFVFGEQVVSQFVLFECKYLFSLIFFYFHKSNSCQDRFHTHAFRSVSIRIFGDYIEEVMDNNKNVVYLKRSRTRFLYIPRNIFHRITKATGCLTFLISGAWDKEWKEYINGEIITYNWGRENKN